MKENTNFKNARKEMEMLLKIEGGMNLKKDKPLRKKLQSAVDKAGESAGRVGAKGTGGGAGAMDAFTANLTDEDIDVGIGQITDPQEFLKDIAQKAGLAYKDIKEYDLTDEDLVDKLTSLILSTTARERRIFPVKEETPEKGKPILTIAIADPMDITLVDDLRLMLPEHDIEPVVCNEQDIIDAIDKHYGEGEEGIEEVIGVLEMEEGQKSSMVREGEVEISVEDLANQPQVIKLVNLLLIQAVKDRASDLHIEPFAGRLRIRYRVDGMLREIPSPPKSLQLGLITRLKVMAALNISENRRPQDGRIRLNIDRREVDLRLACVPTVHGESIVMRVLDKSSMMIGVSQLGMQEDVMKSYLTRARKPNGIVLVTGPTGSGKTTTLYATLREIYDSGTKFITTEDPVEFELPGIVQVNINAKVGLTFAACLRSILRQDPDVILVGEIRDVETAQISIQAALTGHMVLSTLHTNSAAATVTRLIDMGVEPFLLTSTIQAVVGQRLLRTICPTCKTPYFPTDEELADFGIMREEVEDIDFYQGRGCDDCNFTGYKGRIGIYEVMEASESIQELILQGATTDDIHAMAVHEGMVTLRQDGWMKICMGITTFEEVSKHTIPETEESVKAEMESVRRSLTLISKAQKARDEEGRIDDDDADEAHDFISLEEVSPEASTDHEQLPPPEEYHGEDDEGEDEVDPNRLRLE